ncbi:tyrosine-protein kinase HTK16-like [Liolophura sinensis]|uniref:tyrosine-protein kinase HTK16-like n=1 Tax=Liolophura sinensis TaxID=3198878 RepID=UPI00315819C6
MTMDDQDETVPRLCEQLSRSSLRELLRQDREKEEIAEAQVSWYHGKISRETAETILRQGIADHGNIDGLFLVRESTASPKDFVLSLMYNREPYHFVIQNQCEGHYRIDQGPVIHGLDELIQRYKENDHGLPHKLTQFCIDQPPPHQARKFGHTNILHRAVGEGNVQITQEILNSVNHPDVNKKNADGSTALHDASFYGLSEIVSLLLAAGANANSRDSGAYTALARACCGGSGRPNSVAVLITQGGADPQEPCPKTGWVPLHEAAMRGHCECVKMLLAFDAPLMSRTHDGDTPCDIAQKYGKLECASLLSRYVVPKPQLKKEQWYHGNLDRQGAARLFTLHGVQDGLFLIRPNSRRTDFYVLSLCFNRSPYNYEIRKSMYQNKHVYYIDDGPFLPSLDHIVYHYSKRADGLPCRLAKAISPNNRIVEVSVVPPLEEENEYSNYKQLTSPDLPPRPDNVGTWGMTNKGTPPPLPSYPPPKKTLISIPAKRITTGSLLGEGEYGAVYKGVYDNGKEKRDVAIKCFHDDQVNVMEDFMKEATTMQGLDHVCIVKLIGVSKSPLMMIQEFVPQGSMLDFLYDHPDQVEVKVDLYLWATQIACGMMYLEEKHLIHRDLAARNILLQSKRQIKISDFGLSRAIGADNDYYRASRGGRWPIKWYAPECVNYGQFSHASDVWSYGVTLWEMFTFGEPPYGDKRGAEVIKDIERGKRLPKPDNCEAVTYDLMLSCWSARPADRPTFAKLHRKFQVDDEYQTVSKSRTGRMK